jgi:hypothetical protein
MDGQRNGRQRRQGWNWEEILPQQRGTDLPSSSADGGGHVPHAAL